MKIRLTLLGWMAWILLAAPLAAQTGPAPGGSGAGGETKASKRHFAFVDFDFIFTLELVRPGVPILNFVLPGKGNYFLKADDIRILAGIKLYRPRLMEVDTGQARDSMRISGIQVHPHSSFGLTLLGDFAGVDAIDRVSIRMGSNQFQLEAIDGESFEVLARQVNRLNLLSPDIREDYRVLKILPRGRRTAGELR